VFCEIDGVGQIYTLLTLSVFLILLPHGSPGRKFSFMQIVMSQSEFSKPDYAALVKAVSHSSPTPEDWLAVGQQIYSPTYGFGQVIGVLGSRLHHS
jgi:hypothetical protein